MTRRHQVDPVGVTPDNVLLVVAASYEVQPDDIVSVYRDNWIVEARNVAAYLIKLTTGLPDPEIGQVLHKDGKTAERGRKRVEAKMVADATFADHVYALFLELDKIRKRKEQYHAAKAAKHKHGRRLYPHIRGAASVAGTIRDPSQKAGGTRARGSASVDLHRTMPKPTQPAGRGDEADPETAPAKPTKSASAAHR